MENKLPICTHCKTKPNRPVMIQKKVKKRGREFIEEEQVWKTFSCKCGKCEFSGDLKESEIDYKNKVITSGETNAEEETE